MSDIVLKVGADIKDLETKMKKGTTSVEDFGKKSTETFDFTNESLQRLTNQTSQWQIKSRAHHKAVALAAAEAAAAQARSAATISTGFSGMITGAGKAFSAIRKLAYLLPGIGIGGLIMFAAGPITELAKSLFGASAASQFLAESTKKLNEELGKAAASVQGEIAQVQSLVNIASNLKNSYGDRVEALKLLNKISPEYLGSLNLETIGTDAATQAVLRYNRALLTSANVKVYQKQVEDFSEKIIESRDKIKLLQESIAKISPTDYMGAELLTILNQKLTEQIGLQNAIVIARSKAVVSLQKENEASLKLAPKTGRLKEIDDLIAFYKKEKDLRSNSLADTKKWNSDIKKLQEERDLIDPESAKKAAKAIRTIQDVLKDLEKSQKAITEGGDLFGTDETKANLESLRKAFKEILTDFNTAANKPIILKLALEIKEAEADISKSDFNTALFGKMKKYFDKRPPVVVRPKFKIEPELLDLDGDKIRADLKKKEEDIKNLVDQFAANIESAIEDTVIDIADTFGDALGKSLAGEEIDVPNLFGKLIGNVGQQIQELGKFLIRVGITMESAKEALLALFNNPVALVVSGVALVVLGAVLKAQVQKQYKGFATGVRNFAGGTAMVGERGPELITLPRGSNVIPNGQVNAMGGQQVFIAENVIRGTDIVTIFTRASAYNSRNGF